MKLHHFNLSSASLRVRVALAYKGLDYQPNPVWLSEGEHHSQSYRTLQPQQLVPVLQLDDGSALIQSLAIIEYLEEQYPEPPLLPEVPEDRAYVRAISQIVACEIHPLNIVRVFKHLRSRFGVTQETIDIDWIPHWLKEGFDALQIYIEREARHGKYCLGDQFTIADICLLGQVSSAARLGFNVAAYPTIVAIACRCEELAAVKKARVVE